MSIAESVLRFWYRLCGWNTTVPEDALGIQDEDLTVNLPSDAVGSVLVMAGGSFGANTTGRLLVGLDAIGMEGTVGQVLLCELDAAKRRDWLDSLPQSYEGRVVAASVPSMSGGGAGRSPEQMEAERAKWVLDLERAGRETVLRYRHRYGESGSEPAVILVFLSPGSSGYAAYPAVSVIRAAFPTARCIAATVLSVHDQQRHRLPKYIERFGAVGVDGFFVMDNLPGPCMPERTPPDVDAAFIESLIGALRGPLLSAAPMPMNNMLNVLFPIGATGSLASIRFVEAEVPIYPMPWRRTSPFAFARGGVVREVMVDLYGRLDRKVSAAADAVFAEDGRSDIEVITTPILPSSLGPLAAEVQARLRSADRRQANREPVFAPVLVDRVQRSSVPVCPIRLTTFAPIADAAEFLRVTTLPWKDRGHAYADYLGPNAH